MFQQEVRLFFQGQDTRTVLSRVGQEAFTLVGIALQAHPDSRRKEAMEDTWSTDS